MEPDPPRRQVIGTRIAIFLTGLFWAPVVGALAGLVAGGMVVVAWRILVGGLPSWRFAMFNWVIVAGAIAGLLLFLFSYVPPKRQPR